MPYYRIRQFAVQDTRESYYVYQGKEEVEVQLNEGYSAVRDMLEYLHYAGTEGRPASIVIYYHEEQLHYFVHMDEDGMQAILQHWVPRCDWVQEDFAPDTSFAKEKMTLRGSTSPLVLKEREENLLDELIRALPRETFLLQIKLGVADNDSIAGQINLLEQTINDMTQKATVHIGEQNKLFDQIKKTLMGGDNRSYELVNINVKQQLDILENHLYTLNSQGAVFSSTEFTVYAGQGIASLIASKMEAFTRRSGSQSLHRLRRAQTSSPVEFLNYVNVNNLSALLAFPMRPVPGFKQNRRVTFGADISDSENNAKNRISLGRLILEHETRVPVSLPLADLTRHVFVAGVTGSGKTSTIKSMLIQVYEQKKPFLVMEPAKTEYKYLDTAIPMLKRYILGIEGAFSLKINPFAFPEHIHIQTHLDHLKSVFIAAFPMYGPMPYILETAFYDIYRRTGWDFISGRNIHESGLHRDQLFPTLEDLNGAIDFAIEAAGYSVELSSDLRGALKVRIGSLLSGAKGNILNCRSGISMKELLQTPTIIELEHIGDDQEKVFLMGLLLISIYEYYVSEGLHSEDLQHLLVIEEAHRLLTNVQVSGNQEQADMKGKAVETFNNMLSEIRTYGQGMLIADQIPNKLSQDVIKNTNLKIAHRLFAKDDRQVIGDSIGLQENEMEELIRLKQGEAVIFHGDVDRAMKVKIDVDAATLASNRKDVQRPSVALFSAEDYLLQQDGFREDCYRLINTCLLFPELQSAAEQRLAEMAEEQFGLLLPVNHSYWWSKLLERYFKSKLFTEQIPYIKLIQLLEEIGASVDPLAYMVHNTQGLIRRKGMEHPMHKFSAVYNKYQCFRFLLPVSVQELTSFIAALSKPAHYESLLLVDQLLNKSNMSKNIYTELMNPDHRKQLCNAMMITQFGDQPDLLDLFFGVKNLSPEGWIERQTY
ncbi:ATP-binding protein [Paenibacillus sp. FSL R5-0486]|uniref:ATP-binding protein n=1 Tax=Paenibacillus sp. FSL R5-0486 TaxID=2921645 RepID=UPI0030DB174E